MDGDVNQTGAGAPETMPYASRSSMPIDGPIEVEAMLDSDSRGGARFVRFFEVAAVFLIGVMVMAFFQYHPGALKGDDAGLPGNDSFYHVKMASMLPEVGLVRTFPWLRYVYFTKSSDDFVSHHYGFHVLLLPFVTLSKWLVGDYLAGGRWAICTCFGLVTAFYYMILRRERVPWRMLWVLLFFAMPIQFYTRHSFIRAISPSLMVMLLLVWALLERRWLMALLVSAIYNHLYLGAVMYTPVIVVCFTASCIFGQKGEREIPWKVVVASTVGWLIGVLTYPYLGGMLEFLKLQVFGTGLTADIEVGSEWKPYDGVWWFAVQFAGPILAIWTISLVTRLRLGPRLSANETLLLLLHFAFLLLTLKSRRFIEYWPAFCLLSAAVMSRPLVGWVIVWIEKMFVRVEGLEAIVAWAMWGGAALIVSSVFLFKLGPSVPSFRQQLAVSPVFWIAITIGVLTPVACAWWRYIDQRYQTVDRDRFLRRRALVMLPMGCMAAVVVSVVASVMWVEVRRSSKCSYDIPEIRKMMAAIEADSRPGDVIFTSDWDDFPVYFYYNSYNNYIVGLDPKFTQERRPDLWERYVRITRGQVPSERDVKMRDSTGREFTQKVECKVEDIRDHFHAQYVISDKDHVSLSAKVAGVKDFAELIYPAGGWAKNRGAKYVAFRIKPSQTPASGPAPE